MSKKTKSNLKRGRGNQKQSTIAVVAESTKIENIDLVELDKSCRYFNMKKIKNLEAKTAHVVIKDFIDKDNVNQTDKSTTFSGLSDCIDVHVKAISGTNEGKFNLKWVHIAISNLKKHLLPYDYRENDAELP